MALVALLVIGVSATANETWVSFKTKAMTTAAPTQQLAGVNEQWRQHRALSRRSLGFATATLKRALVSRTTQLSDDLFSAYHRSDPPVRDGRWKDAAMALEERGAGVAQGRHARGRLAVCAGTDSSHSRRSGSQSSPDERADTFHGGDHHLRRGGRQRPTWADPYFGLVRTSVYGLDDIDAALGALNKAIDGGFVPGTRESAQLADGYKRTADRLRISAKAAPNVDGERDLLTRAAAYYIQAIRRYEDILDFGSAEANLQSTHDWLTRVERRLAEIERASTGLQGRP